MKSVHRLLLVGSLLPAVSMGQTILSVSSWVPPTHALSLSQKEWCEQVELQTTGGIKCNFLPKAVAAPPGTFDAVRDGLADISFTVDGYTPGRFVFTQIAEFPFSGKDAETTSAAYQKIYDKYFAPLGEHRGVKVLGVYTHGPGTLYNTKKPVANSADVASLKLRIPGGTVSEVSKAMGWNVTLKPATEAYELMSTGILDGTFITVEAVKSLNLNMIKFATFFPGGVFNTSAAFIMNPAKYASLSPEHKAVVDRLSGEAASRIFARGYDRADQAGYAYVKANNIQVTEANAAFVTDIRQKTATVDAKWIAAAEAKGLKNAKAVLEEFRIEATKSK